MKKRIVFFHVLNDFSGSPNILSLVLKGFVEKGYVIDLYTSSIEGFLSGINGINYYRIYYKFLKNKFFAALLYIYSQIRSFFVVLKYVNEKDTLIYLNTILPFGAAIAGRLIGKKIIYHVHENPIKRNIFHRISIFIFMNFASKAVFVSQYLYESFPIDSQKKVLIHNALSPEFVLVAEKHNPKFPPNANILMACSLKTYKGVMVFIKLAEKLSFLNFTLVLNADQKEIKQFFKQMVLPPNIKIFPSTRNMHTFYSTAQIVVNLSIPNAWIETFGLTILEALNYGIPVIVPPVGGISELVEDGINGFKIDSRDHDSIINGINLILSNEKYYFNMSANAKLKASEFSYNNMIEKIEKVLKDELKF